MLLTAADRFARVLDARGLPRPRRRRPTTLQVNLGKVCNQSCRHCHVDAGPLRTESMDGPTADRVLELLASDPGLATLDLTGGAPELNPHFRRLVTGARALGREVIDRCNLTVLLQPGQHDTGEFLAGQGVTVIASLPCYLRRNVDGQRGGGVFDLSLLALQHLNALGYGAAQGAPDPDAGTAPLRLHLVYNPAGATLPPPQADLERDYRRHLRDDYGLRFDRLLCLANMPIHRFAEDLQRRGELAAYADLLERSFNPAALHGLMCRDLLSVDWDGALADCDFHQMLGLPLGGRRRTIFDLHDPAALAGETVATADHCLGCTAGQGSSCGGALAG